MVFVVNFRRRLLLFYRKLREKLFANVMYSSIHVFRRIDRTEFIRFFSARSMIRSPLPFATERPAFAVCEGFVDFSVYKSFYSLAHQTSP